MDALIPSRQTQGHIAFACALPLLATSAFSFLGAYSRSPLHLWVVEGSLVGRIVKVLLLEKLTAGVGHLTRGLSTRSLLTTGLGTGALGAGLSYGSLRCLDHPKN